jgi:RHS repeat-associated protein
LDRPDARVWVSPDAFDSSKSTYSNVDVATTIGIYECRNDFYPFGGEQSSSVQEATNFGFFRSDPMKFTGHDREYYGILNVDNNDYIDYMHARYYNPNQERFLSVDPALSVKLATANPQAWNRYSYVANNPINRIDPTGLDWFHVGDTWEWHKRHKYKNPQGYQYLMVATSTGKTNKAGATMFNVKLKRT